MMVRKKIVQKSKFSFQIFGSKYILINAMFSKFYIKENPLFQNFKFAQFP